MTISLREQLRSASSLEDIALSPALLGYFHAMSQDEAHELIVDLFQRLALEKKVTRAFVARRLHKRPEQVTRWLSAPGNWTSETFTNLALALGHKPKLALESLADIEAGNERANDGEPVEDTKLSTKQPSSNVLTPGLEYVL